MGAGQLERRHPAQLSGVNGVEKYGAEVVGSSTSFAALALLSYPRRNAQRNFRTKRASIFCSRFRVQVCCSSPGLASSLWDLLSMKRRVSDGIEAFPATDRSELEAGSLYQGARSLPAMGISMRMRARERRLWTAHVRELEARKNARPARKQRAKKPGSTPAELEAALEDLVKAPDKAPKA